MHHQYWKIKEGDIPSQTECIWEGCLEEVAHEWEQARTYPMQAEEKRWGRNILINQETKLTVNLTPLVPLSRQWKMAELSREVTSMSAQRSQDQNRYKSQDMGLHQAKQHWGLPCWSSS